MRGLSDGILCLAGYAAKILACAIEKNQRQCVRQFFQCISVGFGLGNNNGCCICGRCKVPDSHFQLPSFVEAEQKIKRCVCLLDLSFHCRSEEVDFCAERDRWKKQCDGKLRRGNNRRRIQLVSQITRSTEYFLGSFIRNFVLFCSSIQNKTDSRDGNAGQFCNIFHYSHKEIPLLQCFFLFCMKN